MNYQESRKYIEDSQKYGSVLGLDNMRELMGRLGNPQDKLKIIHVAGTNGKGSVIAYLYTVLREAGYRVGRYISPALYSYRERMEVSGEAVSREDFAICLSRTAQAISQMTEEGLPHPTPFEIETAVAFLFFEMKKCELVLLEVGMGGSLDATNIIKTPVLSVLASISIDHIGFLGNTLGEIAKTKAGIIKKGCPMITIHQKAEAENAIKDVCGICGVPFREADGNQALVIEESPEGQSFRYEGEEYRISLGGVYQKENAVLAIETLKMLSEIGFPTIEEQRKEGLFRTRWNGRFTVLSREPLFIVDGAHNPAAAEKMASSIRHYFDGKKIYFIIGMFRDKDYREVLSKTCPYAEKIFTIEAPDNPRALPAEELALAAREFHRDVQAMKSVEEAVETAYSLAGEEDVILAFGSLAFIGVLSETVEKRKDEQKNVGLTGMQKEN